MIRSLLRTCSPFLLAAALLVAANPAHALLHIINFSDPSVTGSFDITLDGSSSYNCTSGPPCAFNSFNVSFSGGEFTLDDLPGEVFIGYVGTGGFVDELFILMSDEVGTASGANLEMFNDPNTFSINPSGTYTITVPEPGLAGLFVFAALGLAALRRRG